MTDLTRHDRSVAFWGTPHGADLPPRAPTIGHDVPMIQLIAEDESLVLSDGQVTRIKYFLLEFIPATACDVKAGPGIEIRVPNHGVDELAPGIRSEIEATIGCRVQVFEQVD